METKEIIARAMGQLPPFKEYPNETVHVVVENLFPCVLINDPSDPAQYRYYEPYYEVEFRKRITNHQYNGWEFVQIIR